MAQNRSMKYPANATKEQKDETCNAPSKIGYPPVCERIIFCIDGHFSTRMIGNVEMAKYFLSLIVSYMEIKTQIAAKQVEFAVLLLGQSTNKYLKIPSKKYLNNAMVALLNLSLDECEPFDLSTMFSDLAEAVELPDDKFYSEIPPPHVYHFILFFGRNTHIPTLESSNPYFFLINSPFVTLDILYIPEVHSKKKHKISQALQCLVRDGYFAVASNIFELNKAMNTFLGHKLVRFPQSRCISHLSGLPLPRSTQLG